MVWLMRVAIEAHPDPETSESEDLAASGEVIPDSIAMTFADEKEVKAARTTAAKEKQDKNRALVLEAVEGLGNDPDPSEGRG